MRCLPAPAASKASSIVAAVQDFDFMGGSLGTAAGEAVIAAMRAAVKRETPFILFAASGGARMQEGILSLMQMPRTTVAVQELREARLPYIVVLTHPDHRRRHRLLCHAGRHPYRRARRADRLCRPARDRADHPRAAAERLPARRISATTTAWSTWWCTATSCADARPHLPPPDPPRPGTRHRGLPSKSTASSRMMAPPSTIALSAATASTPPRLCEDDEEP